MLNFMTMTKEQLNEELERIDKELNKPISNIIKYLYMERKGTVLEELERRNK